jgi:internalin A
MNWKETTIPRTFTDWCLNKNQESVETLHTIDVLLQVAQTTDCHQASELLSTRTELYINQLGRISLAISQRNLDPQVVEFIRSQSEFEPLLIVSR